MKRLVMPIVLSIVGMLMGCEMKNEKQEFLAKRISQSATMKLYGTIEEVFPLFGPIREMDWEPGWSPKVIYPKDQLVEEHMIFTSPGRFEGEALYTWMITQYYPEQYMIEYTVSTSDRVWTIRVKCLSQEGNTLATVTYTYTGLNNRGNDLNEIALKNMYERNLEDWAEALNYYLETGRAIESNGK